MHRYVIVLPLTPLEVGFAFSKSEWPLHITVVPPFMSASPASEIAAVVDKAASVTPAPRVRADGETMFGARHDVPVTIVAPRDELQALHDRLLDALESAGVARMTAPHIRGDYRPHVTANARGRLDPGGAMALAQLALLQSGRLGIQIQWRVIQTVHLR